MNRLTKRSPYTGIAGTIDEAARLSITDRLAAYEDTGLEPEEIPRVVATLQTVQKNKSELFETLSRYLNAEAEGRLLVLPCKVGDTVYIPIGKCRVGEYYMCPNNGGYGTPRCGEGDQKCKAHVVERPFSIADFPYIGKTIFLTKEEAEAVLKGGKVDA